jgi:hypothetical protein
MTIRGKTVEQILLDVLKKRGPKQWWNPFQRGFLDESSLGAICDALGKIGTQESLTALNQLAKDRDVPWATKAKEACKKIGERAHPS